MARLTKQFVDFEIKLPASGQRFYRDDDMPGFAIRATPKSNSYVLEKRVDRVNRRITIGKCSDMSLDNAKEQACIMLGDIARGKDPKTGKPINVLHQIKRLVNHSVSTNTTGGYVILDIERIRPHMSRITEAFINLLGINNSDMKEWKPVKESDLTEVTQLQINLGDIPIL
jgi:hypothetical protein